MIKITEVKPPEDLPLSVEDKTGQGVYYACIQYYTSIDVPLGLHLDHCIHCDSRVVQVDGVEQVHADGETDPEVFFVVSCCAVDCGAMGPRKRT